MNNEVPYGHASYSTVPVASSSGPPGCGSAKPYLVGFSFPAVHLYYFEFNHTLVVRYIQVFMGPCSARAVAVFS